PSSPPTHPLSLHDALPISKDACVSFYFYFQSAHHDLSLGDFVPLFVSGKLAYGSHADHILSWWPHKDDSNVLLLTYEEMKSDVRDRKSTRLNSSHVSISYA